jgi:hypothetical protein
VRQSPDQGQPDFQQEVYFGFEEHACRLAAGAASDWMRLVGETGIEPVTLSLEDVGFRYSLVYYCFL